MSDKEIDQEQDTGAQAEQDAQKASRVATGKARVGDKAIPNRIKELRETLEQGESDSPEESRVVQLEVEASDGGTEWIEHPIMRIPEDKRIEYLTEGAVDEAAAVRIIQRVVSDMTYASTITGAVVTLCSDAAGSAGFAVLSKQKPPQNEHIRSLGAAAIKHAESFLDAYVEKSPIVTASSLPDALRDGERR